MLYAFNQGDKFVLAIVLVGEDDAVDGPHYVRNPFEREPGWGVSSINYNLSDLLAASRGTMTMSHPVNLPEKLIEVALPLDAINVASRARKVHPPWASRPRCILVGAAAAWRRRGRSSSRSWSTTREDLWRCQNTRARTEPASEGHWTKAASGSSRSSKTSCCGRTPPTKRCWRRPATEIRKSWRETCELNKDHPQAEELFDPDKLPGLARSRSPVAGRSRWKRSGSGWKPTPAT